MSIHTTVNPDVVLQKLRQNRKEAKGGAFVTMPTARLDMAIRLIEQLLERIAELESAQQAMDAAPIEAARVEVVA